MATTTNRANRYPAGADPANVPADIQNLANDLDNVANIYTGTLASRPAASAAAGHGSANPGSFWLASDTGELFLSIAGAWIKITTEPGIPLGAQIPYGGTGDPADTRFLLADGRPLARIGTYASLFSVLGTSYGSGDGSTTFNIPDKRGRVSIGADNMGTAAAAAGRLTTTNKAVGQGNGAEFHTITIAQMPSHNHGGGDHTHAFDASHDLEGGFAAAAYAGGGFGNVTTGALSTVIATQGSDQAHNNVQPGQVDNYLVRVK